MASLKLRSTMCQQQAKRRDGWDLRALSESPNESISTAFFSHLFWSYSQDTPFHAFFLCPSIAKDDLTEFSPLPLFSQGFCEKQIVTTKEEFESMEISQEEEERMVGSLLQDIFSEEEDPKSRWRLSVSAQPFIPTIRKTVSLGAFPILYGTQDKIAIDSTPHITSETRRRLPRRFVKKQRMQLSQQKQQMQKMTTRVK